MSNVKLSHNAISNIMTGLVGTEFLSRVLITDKYFATSDDNPSVKIVTVIHAIFLNTLRDIVDNE